MQSAGRGRLRDGEHTERIAVHVRHADVVGDHRAIVGNGQPSELHGSRNLRAGGPGRAAVGGRCEADIQLASAGCAIGVGIVVVDDGDVGMSAGGGEVRADAGDEVVHFAGDGVYGNAADFAPGGAVGGRAHDDVVGTATGPEAAVRPHDVDFSSAVNAGGRQVWIAQSVWAKVAGDGRDRLAL